MAGIKEVRSVSDLTASMVSPDKIPQKSVRSVILKHIFVNHIPVELSYSKERVMCYLIGYDTRFRDEVYQDIDSPERIFVVPARQISKVVVVSSDKAYIIKMALQKFMADQLGTELLDDE